MNCRVFLLSLAAIFAATAAADAASPAPTATTCVVPRETSGLAAPLPRVAAKIARGEPVRVVALGSSSTAGSGASAPDRAYPARLAAYLAQRLPEAHAVVLNKGVGGETDDEMFARIDRDVIAQHPDLVIWQVGANTVLRFGDTAAADAWVRRGVDKLKASGADLVLMDIQYARNTLANPKGAADMLARTARIAADEHLGLFRRYAVMQGLVESRRMSLGELVGPDGTHQTDAGYDCIARALAAGIRDAVQTQSAAAAAKP